MQPEMIRHYLGEFSITYKPIKAAWALTEPGAAEPLASGVVETFTAYSAFGTTVATQEAQADARDRLAIALADLIVTDIILATEG